LKTTKKFIKEQRKKKEKKNLKTYIYKLELKTNKNFKKEKQTKIKNQN
jgi:hypothetical protein